MFASIYTQEFTGSLKPTYPPKWPPKLTFHTATCLVNPDAVNKSFVPGGSLLTQKLLVVWGKDADQSISNDMWLLEIDVNDCSSLKWKKVFMCCLKVQDCGIKCFYSRFHPKPTSSPLHGTLHNHTTLMVCRLVWLLYLEGMHMSTKHYRAVQELL